MNQCSRYNSTIGYCTLEHKHQGPCHYDPTLFEPGITVLIAAHPARLRNGMLTNALASVAAQTKQPEAVVVVNDCDRKGAGATRRTLLSFVKTEWIAWIDSDDEWLPEHLEKLYRVAVETDSVYVFSYFHGADPFTDGGKAPDGHLGRPFNVCDPHHTTMAILERTDIALEAGFDDSQPGPFSNEDWGHISRFCKIACERGLKVTHLPERTWIWRQQGQNSSGQPNQGDAR